MKSVSFSGQVLYYRLFDVGSEIDLGLASQCLHNNLKPFQLQKNIRRLIMGVTPLVVDMGQWSQVVFDSTVDIQAIGKIWPFGCISIQLRLYMSDRCSIDKMKSLASYLENDTSLHQLTLHKVNGLVETLKSAIKNLEMWEHYEDYLIFKLAPSEISTENIQAWLTSNDLYQLILADPGPNVSEQMIKPIREHVFQYTNNDLVVLDWNSAFIASLEDSFDLADVIEFALCQLLELRYYDDLLDKKLSTLYRSIDKAEPSLFSNFYGQKAREASLIYIDISEIIEKIETSVKVIGDFYYAKIFRAAMSRFDVKSWQQSVDNKLKNLVEVSMLFQSQINEKRNQFLEIVIILLIALEMIPLISKLF